jgi:hypothetical protein
MSDRILFRKLLHHFLMGAALGGVFFGAVLVLNENRAFHLAQDVASSWTNAIILLIGCCTYFAFGATITGFHFVVTEDDTDRCH